MIFFLTSIAIVFAVTIIAVIVDQHDGASS